ncbi:MAG TPA: hypothetical protein GYA10_16235 [Alphaproteobacteria bacterium]|nr:hypothetical protein [Alphaproteobacteria bacterium]
MLSRIVLAIALLVAFASALPTSVSAAAPTPVSPAITVVETAEYGGLSVWRVTFASGAMCDVPVALVDTLAGATAPRVGATQSYRDTRMFIAGVRVWGELSFTDSAGRSYTGY